MRSPASQSRSLKHKLTVAFMITGMASLLMACAGFVAYELITFRRTMTNDLTTNANIIVSNSTAPLAFEDRDAAKETLGTLRSRPRIVSAAIYQEQKGLFTSYVREGWRSRPPPKPGPDGCRFENGSLILFQPIVLGGKRIATLYIQSDLEAMRARFRSYAWIVLLVLLTSVLAAFVVSRILQRRITYPIGKLAETIRGVADKKDYSLRAHKYSDDELGLFADAFNEMLGRIEERDATLQQSNQALTEEVAERRRAEADLIESGRRFRFLADAMPQIVWTADSKGNADYYNERWYDYTGFSRDETSGSSWETALLPEERELAAGRWREAVRTGGDYQAECRLKKAGEEEPRWHLARALPRRNETGAIVQWIATYTDIDDQKRTQEEIRRLNLELEQRVLDRTEQLQAANKELEAFSYSISHDLRAPLRHINGFVELLANSASERLDDKCRRYLNIIADSAKQMGMLVDALLEFSRLGRSEPHSEIIDLNRLAREVVSDLRGEEQDREIVWTVSDLPDVWADRVLLRQVVVNLVSNAVKYTRKRNPARIEIGCKDGHAGETVFFVRDNGAGFDMKYQDKLFGVFQRLHRADQFEGTGIGLANVRRIVDRHGGRTWAEGAVDGGATFYFTLPDHSCMNTESAAATESRCGAS